MTAVHPAPPVPKPDAGCPQCDHRWLRLHGTWQWVPVWSLHCDVHRQPSDLRG